MTLLKRMVVLAALALPTAALAASDPRFGAWTCEFAGTPFGKLVLTQTTYSFTDAATGIGSSGGASWVAETFGLKGGGLLKLGIHSGLVYAVPDKPEVMALDLYADMGTVVTCHR